jgi:hypothetical protein
VDVEPLAQSAIGPADLDALCASVGTDKIGTLLSYISAVQTVRQLAAEIDTAASRIHSLVAAVKGFTYVNQQATLQPIAIGRGLADTLTVLQSKAIKSVTWTAFAERRVDSYGGAKLVWANLDNATMPEGTCR